MTLAKQIDKQKIGEVAREAGIKAALAAASGDDSTDAGDAADDDAGVELTCPKCGHSGGEEEFQAASDDADDVGGSDDSEE